MTFVSETVKSLLLRAKFSKERTNIDNGHAVMAQDLPRLNKMAAVIGLDLNTTEYTYQVVRKDGELNVYGACVMSDNGIASIFWGKSKVALKNIAKPAELSIVPEGKGFVLDVFYPADSAFDSDVNFQVPLVISKKLSTKPEHAELRTALRNGKLGDYLTASFIKPKKLSELEPGIYKVTGYAVRYWNGDPKVELTLQGVGLVAANTALKNKLLAEPVITEAQPATLEVGISTRMTTTGFPVIPVVLTTAADAELPVFDFSDPADLEAEEQLSQLSFSAK